MGWRMDLFFSEKVALTAHVFITPRSPGDYSAPPDIVFPVQLFSFYYRQRDVMAKKNDV